MTPFEEALRQALARQEPSAGFSERVLARVDESKRRSHRAVPWRLACAAAATLLLAGGTAYQKYERQQERQMQGQTVKRKLMLALQIAGSKLQETQERVNQIENREAIQ